MLSKTPIKQQIAHSTVKRPLNSKMSIKQPKSIKQQNVHQITKRSSNSKTSLTYSKTSAKCTGDELKWEILKIMPLYTAKRPLYTAKHPLTSYRLLNSNTSIKHKHKHFACLCVKKLSELVCFRCSYTLKFRFILY